MTTPALREAARAICRVQYNGGDPDQPAVRWNGTEMEPQEFPAWEDFLDEARAVIAALAAPEPEGFIPSIADDRGHLKELINLRARCERLEAALEAGRVLEKALHACITNEEVEIKGTSLGADIVAHALNTFHKLADALRGK